VVHASAWIHRGGGWGQLRPSFWDAVLRVGEGVVIGGL
jgi:hypothetical protein